jgi:hypothetical protein
LTACAAADLARASRRTLDVLRALVIRFIGEQGFGH